jgi:hypothetical protein
MEKGAALNVFFREQNGRLEDTSRRFYGEALYFLVRPQSDIPLVPVKVSDAATPVIH